MSYDIVPGRPGHSHAGPEKGAGQPESLITDEHLRATGFASANLGNRALVEQAVLRRYLLTRALGSSIRNSVQWLGIGLLAIAVLLGLAGLKVLGVLIGLVAIGVLLLRALFSSIQRRLSDASQLGQHRARVEALVGKTRKGLRHELRRVGLPGSPWGPLLIALRLMRRRRRADTVARLAAIDLTAVVPQSRVEELHLVLGTR